MQQLKYKVPILERLSASGTLLLPLVSLLFMVDCCFSTYFTLTRYTFSTFPDACTIAVKNDLNLPFRLMKPKRSGAVSKCNTIKYLHYL